MFAVTWVWPAECRAGRGGPACPGPGIIYIQILSTHYLHTIYTLSTHCSSQQSADPRFAAGSTTRSTYRDVSAYNEELLQQYNIAQREYDMEILKTFVHVLFKWLCCKSVSFRRPDLGLCDLWWTSVWKGTLAGLCEDENHQPRNHYHGQYP